ncbi:hypothetical protein L1O48_09325 [Ligilactobacillus equi]
MFVFGMFLLELLDYINRNK